MNTFPATLDAAVEQAKKAAQTAIADGYNLVQVELVVPEIALQAEALALEFAQLFATNGSRVKVMFPDTGASALAKRNWGEQPFAITDMGSRFTSIETQISEEDEIFIVACPSAVEVERAEKLSQLVGDRPILFLIPQLEDVAVVGIGLAARQLRDRFIKNIYSCYYLRPIEAGAITTKPMGEDLERLMIGLTNPQTADGNSKPSQKKTSLLSNLQKFLNALSQ
jgi:hypothetical protein